MKLFLRVGGTWMMGLTLILLVMDGTRMLASGQFFYTSVANMWRALTTPGFEAAHDRLMALLAPASAGFIGEAVLSWPAWAVTGVAGFLLLTAGRARRRQSYFEPR